MPAALVLRRTAGTYGSIAGYLAGIWLLGFTLGGALCTLFSLRIGSRERWSVALGMAAATWALVSGLFDRVLHVPFPPGQLLLWLGIPTP